MSKLIRAFALIFAVTACGATFAQDNHGDKSGDKGHQGTKNDHSQKGNSKGHGSNSGQKDSGNGGSSSAPPKKNSGSGRGNSGSGQGNSGSGRGNSGNGRRTGTGGTDTGSGVNSHRRTGTSGQSSNGGFNGQQGSGPQHLPRPHVELPRNQVLQKARFNSNNYGSGSHGKIGNTKAPHFGPPPILHGPAGAHIRHGYRPYGSGWRDSFFIYPFYAFDYNPDSCVVSPWYYYPQMPGFILMARLRFGPFAFDFVDYAPYAWRHASYYDPGSENYFLDVAIDRLVRVYQNQDMDALDALVPAGYEVNVQMEDGHSYQMQSNDFHDMVLDNATTTHTDRFSIVAVHRFRAGAKVEAMHTFVDPNGQTTQLLHTYILRQDENGYKIVSLQVTRPSSAF